VEQLIPKKIHYCWFGGNPMPNLMKKCIDSWKKYCPDYEIIEWNENNFNINYCDYVKEAYEAKKWAFVSDVARLYALVTQGGIYMDTDVEVLKPLDDLLLYDAFSGFEGEDRIPTGLMACRKGQPLFAELLHSYDNVHFLKFDGSHDVTTNVTRITNVCLKYGLILNNMKQTINGFTLFPKDYFCPKDYETENIKLTNNTYTIHHFNGSWLSEEDRLSNKLKKKYMVFMPRKIAGYAAKFMAIKKLNGFMFAVKDTFKWIKKKSVY
jgi:mannosyltransferase OCH1-like enzyme